MMLEIGSQAPDFTLPDQNGEPISLSDFRGQTVVLYFYPKDSTPGCTRQARAFAAVYEELQQLGAVVLGVSRDSSASHLRFIQKTVCPSACSPTRNGPSWRPTASGRRKSCTGNKYGHRPHHLSH